MKTRSTTVGLVLMIGMTLALVAHLEAFSVGDIVVRSHREAPFLAEVRLTLEQQERDREVVVALGDHEDYRAEGLTRAEAIDHLDASWHTGARDTVRIVSRVPIQAPSFDLILLVRAGQVTIVRTYQVALPPPPVRPQTVARSETPAPSKPRKIPAASPSPPTPKTTSHTSALPPWLQRVPERYGPIRRGDTLFGVAKALGAPKGTIWQTIVLIWQANKPKFSGSNMHGLRSGANLSIPPDLAEGIAAMSGKEAQQIVAQQWDAWQTLRSAVSGRQRVTPPREKTAALAEEPVAPRPDPMPSVEETSGSDEEEPVSAAAEEKSVSAAAEEKPVSAATVMLPAEGASPVAGVADVRSVLQGLEEILAQRLPQAGGVGNTVSFVSETDLQVALQGLEERITQRLQDTLQQATVLQKTSQRSSQSAMGTPTWLEQMLPANSMMYVLLVENALLVLLAAGILWRWYRTRA